MHRSLIDASVRTSAWWFIVFVAALAIGFPVDLASGQRAGPQAPQPITAEELDRYARMLGLSEAQRQAVDARFEAYLREYREHHKHELDAMVDGQIGARQADAAEIKRSIERFNRAMRRFADLDTRFLNEVQDVLADEQTHRMIRVRMARERKRYEELRLGVLPVPRRDQDLSRLIEALDLTDEHREAIDPILYDYEQRLTRRLRERHDADAASHIRFHEATASVRERIDETNRAEAAQLMRDAMSQAMREPAERHRAVIDQHRRTLEQLRHVLPEREWRQLRRDLYSGLFMEMHHALSNSPSDLISAVLQLDDLDDAAARRVDALRREVVPQFDRVLESYVDELSRDGGMSHFQFDPDAMRERFEQRQTLGTELAGIRTSVTEVLQREIGPELLARARQQQQQTAQRAARPRPARATSRANMAGLSDVAFSITSQSEFVPGPIRRMDIERFANRARIDDAGRAVLNDLFDAYQETYAEASRHSAQHHSRLYMSMFRFGRDDGKDRPDPARVVAELNDIRRSAVRDLMAVDESFIEDLAAAVLDDSHDETLERLRLMRHRAFYGVENVHTYLRHAQARPHRIDLIRLVEAESLTEDELKRIDPILHAYEREATRLLRRLHETTLDLARVTQQQQAGYIRAFDESNTQDRAQAIQEIREQVSRLNNHVDQHYDDLRQLNEETLDRITKALPERSGQRVRYGFNIRAYREVYAEESRAHDLLTAALDLPDLTDRQRDQLRELTTEYQPAYEALTARMLELYRQRAYGVAGEADRTRPESRVRTGHEYTRAELERKELNQRIRRQLRSILRPAQLERIDLGRS